MGSSPRLYSANNGSQSSGGTFVNIHLYSCVVDQEQTTRLDCCGNDQHGLSEPSLPDFVVVLGNLSEDPAVHLSCHSVKAIWRRILTAI